MEEKNNMYMECLDLAQEYTRARQDLDNLLKQGFLGLMRFKCSQSRYLMGLQSYFPKRMRATRRIRIQGCDRSAQSTDSIEMTRESAVKVNGENNRDPVEDVRQFISQLEFKYVSTEKKSRYTNDDMDDTVTHDPVEWFGGICHPSLKDCAKVFRAVMDKVEEIAQIIYNLQISLREYQSKDTFVE